MSSCYVMPVMVDDPEIRGDVRIAMRENHGVQTSLFYPSTHHFTAYRERFGDISLPHTEHASATEITIPLYPHLTGDDQGRVVNALRTELERAS